MSYTYGTGSNANYSGRPICYPDQVPFDTDLLRESQYRMVDVALLAQTILGLPSTFGGSYPALSSGICTQNASPDLTVEIGVCALYMIQEMEPIAYGNLGPLTTPLIYKQAINMIAFNSGTLGTITAPSGGNSQYYLIQGGFQTTQINSVNRPYYNPSNPASPNFNSADDTEIDNIVFSLVAGTPSMSPAIPSPTGGAIGMFVILVTTGQTQILNADISGYPGSFISETLIEKISQATADARYVQIANATAPNVQVLTASSGTYTTPTGAVYLRVQGWGDGGGGGGAATSGSMMGAAGGGGGGGGYFDEIISSPSATYAYTVGQGGAGGTIGNNAGTAGGGSSFGSFTAAGGGAGAGGASNSSGSQTGAAGGAASSPTLAIQGGFGGGGIVGVGSIGGAGGNAPNGGQGANSAYNGDAGNVGLYPGGGGSGGSSADSSQTAGGGGSAGAIIVYAYFQ